MESISTPHSPNLQKLRLTIRCGLVSYQGNPLFWCVCVGGLTLLQKYSVFKP